MLNKKIKIWVVPIIITILSFTILPGQADNLLIHENDSCGKILLAEALVEYPFGWFYTLEKIEELYEVEYYENSRLENFIRIENGKYLNQCNNEPSEIPGEFVETTLELLTQILDKKLTKYLFRLDTFHGHFFVSDEQFKKKYLNLNTIEMMEEFVTDNSLGVLIHCAEHLALREPPQTGTINEEARKLIKQRNIIGWYDVKSIEVVTPEKKELVGSGRSNTATIPQGFHGVGFITFRANMNGEFSIKHGSQTIRLDMSLCDYYYY